MVSFSLSSQFTHLLPNCSLKTCPLWPPIAVSLCICMFCLPDQIFHSSSQHSHGKRAFTHRGLLSPNLWELVSLAQLHNTFLKFPPENATWKEFVLIEINTNTSKHVLSI